jgi:DNA-binding transcriptional LysR family regulator
LTGRLDLVALPTLAVDPLAPLLGELRRRHPRVTVRLHQPETTSDLVDLVRSGRCEVGLTELPGGVSVAHTSGGRARPTTAFGLPALALGHQELFAVLPPPGGDGPTAAIDGPVTLAQLADLPLVTSPVGTSTRRLIEQALARLGRVAGVVVETDQREAIVPLVIAGAGVAVLPTSQAASAAAQGARVVPFQPELRRAIGLVHRDGPLSPLAAAFVDLVSARPLDDGAIDADAG